MVQAVVWSGDLRQHKQARHAFKLPVVHDVSMANSAGLCKTLEGPVPYKKGDAIMTGLAGEHWPISLDYFLATYEAVSPTEMGSAGQYRKRKIILPVLQLETATSVKLSNGAVLSGVPGDWLVQYELGSFGIVEKDIFTRTYQLTRDSN